MRHEREATACWEPLEDGGIVVLGGLISDNVTKSEQRVLLLGSIPLLGFACRTPEQTASESGAKYNHMLDGQRRAESGKSGPAQKSPQMDPLPRPAR